MVSGGQNIQGDHTVRAVPSHGQRRQCVGDAAVLHIVVVPQPAGGLAAVIVVQVDQSAPFVKEGLGEFPLPDELLQRPLDLFVEVVDAPPNGEGQHLRQDKPYTAILYGGLDLGEKGVGPGRSLSAGGRRKIPSSLPAAPYRAAPPGRKARKAAGRPPPLRRGAALPSPEAGCGSAGSGSPGVSSSFPEGPLQGPFAADLVLVFYYNKIAGFNAVFQLVKKSFQQTEPIRCDGDIRSLYSLCAKRGTSRSLFSHIFLSFHEQLAPGK